MATTTQGTISGNEWRKAALTAFHSAIADALNVDPDRVTVALSDQDVGTAAVSWTRSAGSYCVADITLYLPTFATDARLNRRDAAILAGYWLHEAMHVMESDEDAMKRLTQEGGQALARVYNGLEDARGEKAFAARGVAANAVGRFRAIAEYICRDIVPGKYDPLDSRNLAFTAAILGRWRLSGTAPEALCVDIWNRCPAWLKAALDAAFAKIDGGTGADAEQAARDLIAAWNAAANERPNPRDVEGQPGDKPGEGEGDQPGEGEGDQPGEGEGDQPGEGEGDQPGEGGKGKGTGDAPGSTIGRDSDMNDAEPTPDDIVDRVGRGDRFDQQAAARPFPRQQGLGYGKDVADAYKARVPGANSIRAHVARILAGQDRSGWVRRLDAGAFDPRQSHRARIGAGDLYRRADRQDAPTAALTILCDQSGSMSGQEAHAAAAMAINLADAADAAGCDVEALGYDGYGSPVRVYRAFGDDPRKARNDLPGLARAGGGTDMTTAIIAATPRLVDTHAERKVMVVLADGDCRNGGDGVRDAIERAKRQGVTVVAVALVGVSKANHATLLERYARAGYPDVMKTFGFDAADAGVLTYADGLSHATLKAVADQLARAGRVAA